MLASAAAPMVCRSPPAQKARPSPSMTRTRTSVVASISALSCSSFLAIAGSIALYSGRPVQRDGRDGAVDAEQSGVVAGGGIRHFEDLGLVGFRAFKALAGAVAIRRLRHGGGFGAPGFAGDPLRPARAIRPNGCPRLRYADTSAVGDGASKLTSTKRKQHGSLLLAANLGCSR